MCDARVAETKGLASVISNDNSVAAVSRCSSVLGAAGRRSVVPALVVPAFRKRSTAEVACVFPVRGPDAARRPNTVCCSNTVCPRDTMSWSRLEVLTRVLRTGIGNRASCCLLMLADVEVNPRRSVDCADVDRADVDRADVDCAGVDVLEKPCSKDCIAEENELASPRDCADVLLAFVVVATGTDFVVATGTEAFPTA